MIKWIDKQKIILLSWRILLQVGPTCKSLDPCGPNILCRDTCEAPFYECVHCDNQHYGLHCDKPKGNNIHMI